MLHQLVKFISRNIHCNHDRWGMWLYYLPEGQNHGVRVKIHCSKCDKLVDDIRIEKHLKSLNK